MDHATWQSVETSPRHPGLAATAAYVSERCWDLALRRPIKRWIMPTLSAPIKEFMRCCEVLLSPPVSRETLTQDELEIIKMYVESLTQRLLR
jgi:hypothetical protein